MLCLSSLMMVTNTTSAQNEQKFKVGCVGFYNLENLFDTIDSPDTRDFEFTPKGKNNWTSVRYLKKLKNMATVISQIATETTPDGLAILGVSEIENRQVLEDLVAQPEIAERNYQIVHYNSPDRRGVDVGLLYQKKYFTVTNTSSHTLHIEGKDDFYTRDQLLVSGIFDGDPLHIIVNHWPSRYGGEKRSRPLRNAAAQLSRHLVDSLLTINPQAKVIVMGDLNDDPVNQSVKKYMKGRPDIKNLKDSEMYNPMEKMYKKGIGSLAYRDSWNLFDQTIITKGLTGHDFSSYKFYKVNIFNKSFLTTKSGQYAGYPFRTFAGGSFLGGYSDHFPVYITLIKEDN